jgi:hypothetical protein
MEEKQPVKTLENMEEKKPVKTLGKEITTIKWKQPKRIAVALVLLYSFSWYLFNDMFNLISSGGIATTGHFFNKIDILAAVPFFLSFIVMISVLITFVVRSTFDTASHRRLNTFVGIWILFGVILMIISMVLMLEGFPPKYTVQWFLNLSRNSIYHLGVFLFQIPGIIYFALFK